jgi:ankyrin repeat protein
LNFERIVDLFLKEDFDTIDTFLTQHGTPLCKSKAGYSLLFFLCQKGKVQAIKKLVAYGINIHHTDEEGFSPLYIAASMGYNDLVRYLLEEGADHTFTNKLDANCSVLQIAATYGHLDVIKTLTTYNADWQYINTENETALSLAENSNRIDVINFLKEIEQLYNLKSG